VRVTRFLNSLFSRRFSQGLSHFLEPCYLVYDVETPALDEASLSLKKCLSLKMSEDSITSRAREKRIERVRLMNDECVRTVGNITVIS